MVRPDKREIHHECLARDLLEGDLGRLAVRYRGPERVRDGPSVPGHLEGPDGARPEPHAEPEDRQERADGQEGDDELRLPRLPCQEAGDPEAAREEEEEDDGASRDPPRPSRDAAPLRIRHGPRLT